jgi:hypothetical protein
MNETTVQGEGAIAKIGDRIIDFTRKVIALVEAGTEFVDAGDRLASAAKDYAKMIWRLNVDGAKALVRGGHLGVDGEFHKGLNPFSCDMCWPEESEARGAAIAGLWSKAMDGWDDRRRARR